MYSLSSGGIIDGYPQWRNYIGAIGANAPYRITNFAPNVLSCALYHWKKDE